MSLESLFLKEVADQDTARKKLSRDMAEWDQELVNGLLEKIPALEGMIIKPKMTHKAEEAGTAVGSIIVMEQKSQKSVFIPVIVKNFQMAPLDVLLVPDQDQNYTTVPLTERHILESLENSQPFNYLEKPIDRIQELYFNPQNTNIFPPYLRNVHASSGVLDSISTSITPEQKAAFISGIKANPSVLIGYEKRANLHLIEKIARSEYETWEEQDHNNPKIIHLKSEYNGKIILTSTPTETFNPIIQIGNVRGEFDKQFPSDTLNEVLTNGEKVIVNNYNPLTSVHVYHGNSMLGPIESPGAYTKADGELVEPDTFARYKIQGKDGIYYTGTVFPTIQSFDGVPTGLKLFYNSNTHSVQMSFAGYYIEPANPTYFECAAPIYGVTGFLMKVLGDKAIALEAVTIKGCVESEESSYYVGETFKGDRIQFYMNYPGKKIVKMNGGYHIPSDFNFYPLKNFKPMAESVESAEMKIASVILDANPVRLIHKGANQYAMKGAGIFKMANECKWDAGNLECGQVAFLLASKKCPMSKVASAIKGANAYPDGVTLHGLSETRYAMPKTAARVISPVNLIKEASYIDDSQVVDTLLGLNFINPENIARFSEMTPLLEQTASKLAQLLLASRLGMTEIPESACASAMYKLVDVTEGLSRLKLRLDKKPGA